METGANTVRLDDGRSNVRNNAGPREHLTQGRQDKVPCPNLVSTKLFKIFITNVSTLITKHAISNILEADNTSPMRCVVFRCQFGAKRAVSDRSFFHNE